MVDPITVAIATVVTKELGPPIIKETVKLHQERTTTRASSVSDVCEALNAPEVVKKVMVGAAIVSGLHPASLALSFVGGVVRGVDRYSKY